MKRKVALVGTGGIARAHVAALREAGARAELVAAVDIDASRVAAFCDAHGVPHHYTDVADMLAAHRPDLVHVCTPPATHCDLVIQCLEAGAWVLCEKPLCASLAEMDRLDAAERRTGRYVSSVFQRRFGSGAQHLKRLMDAGALGRPLLGLCQTTWYRDDAYYAVPWRGRWATEIGGTTMIHGIHQMDMALWLLGDWQEVTAMIGTLNHAIEVDDVALLCARFANGAMLSVVNSAVSPRQETYMRLDFEKVTVELRYLYDYTNADWTYTLPDGSPDHEALAAWQAIPDEIPSSHTPQIMALLDSMVRGVRPPVSGPDARRTLEFATALYKSAFTGQPVRQGSITPDDPFYHAMHGAP
ncbi:MAG: Gfo/Idh/MocA family oxidoreductase [Anaerolineae bacterium]|nr:Gfo/Idh/MocA family oxidoreductase [Anaerolineae bacterium]